MQDEEDNGKEEAIKLFDLIHINVNIVPTYITHDTR